MDCDRRSFLRRAGIGALSAGPFVKRARAQERTGLKLFFNCDMDGSPGIFTREQAWYWESGARPEIGLQARELFTADIDGISAAALDAGATELIVCDTHHGGGNLIQEKVLKDPRITYLFRSVGMEGNQRRWLPGLDRSVAGFLLPGHHAKPGSTQSFLPHTWNFEWLDFTINGMSVGEIGIETCYAGHWDVPLIFVQGDEAACFEAHQQFPGVVTAAVKRGGANPEKCVGMDPSDAARETARQVKHAVERLKAGDMKPFKPELPMTITLKMRTMDAAAKAAQRPGVLRIDDHRIEARVGSQAEVVKWLLGTGLDMAPAPGK
jgi:D-amino peptidase